MTTTIVRSHEGIPPSDQTPREGARSQKRFLAVPIILQIVAMIGLGSLLYSHAADWFARLHHNADISGYVRAVEQLPSQEREELLRVAHEYNSHLPAGVLRDPYTAGAIDPGNENLAYQAYLDVLAVSDNGVIGNLTYPRLGIGLPIYHGTDSDVLDKGIGHLYGSSLPIGGPSTHSVLTTHSGLIHAHLFTPLLTAEVGDTFQISVLGETLYYQVEDLQVVLPEETENLAIIEGEDHVTLITCTPVGINSHRLLVHGVRVDAPPSDTGDRAIAGDGLSAGFPWWAVAFIGGSAAIAYLLFAPPKKKGRGGKNLKDEEYESEVAHSVGGTLNTGHLATIAHEKTAEVQGEVDADTERGAI